MPYGAKCKYVRDGRKIYEQGPGGQRKLKQTCSSIAQAKRALRLLYGIKSGDWKPTGKKAKR